MEHRHVVGVVVVDGAHDKGEAEATEHDAHEGAIAEEAARWHAQLGRVELPRGPQQALVVLAVARAVAGLPPRRALARAVPLVRRLAADGYGRMKQ